MKAALGAGLLLAVLTANNCGSPLSAPVAPVAVTSFAVPASPIVRGRYLFTVTASPSCPNAGQGTLLARKFEFELVPEFPAGPFLVQPVRREIAGPNSGSVALLMLPGIPAGGAMLTGSGLATDGLYVVGFGLGVKLPVEGYAFLFPTTGAPPNEMTGDLQGTISTTVYNSSAGGLCLAADHRYKLTPMG